MRRVTVLGLDGGALRESALAALSRAELVLGWPEHLTAVRHLLPPRAEVLAIDRDLPATLAALRDGDGEAVVLTSGDPGFHGIAGAVASVAEEVEIVPAVTSVAEAFARVGLPWEDAHLVSAHHGSPHRAIAVCRRFDKVAVLTGPELGPAELGAALRGLERELVVAERLGQRGEHVTRVTPEQAAERDWDDPNVVLVLAADGPADRPFTNGRTWTTPPRTTAEGWALPGDGDPDRLPPAVAATVLGWLGPGLGDLVWTLGSPALAFEVSRLGAASIAVDEDPGDAAPHARAGVPISVVRGRAPAVLADLPDPDVVAVVGGDHLLTEVVRTAADRARRAVVVVLDDAARLGPVRDALAEAGLLVGSARVGHVPLRPGQPDAPAMERVLVRGGRR
jgi:precorrin-6Y C5,15-methyltransferase (decarboxylating)